MQQFVLYFNSIRDVAIGDPEEDGVDCAKQTDDQDLTRSLVVTDIDEMPINKFP